MKSGCRSLVDGLWPLVAVPGIPALLLDLQYFPVHFPSLYSNSADTHRQLEPSWARAAGIEIEDAIFHVLLGHVAMARDHGGKSGGFGLQIQLIQIMQDINI